MGLVDEPFAVREAVEVPVWAPLDGVRAEAAVHEVAGVVADRVDGVGAGAAVDDVLAVVAAQALEEVGLRRAPQGLAPAVPVSSSSGSLVARAVPAERTDIAAANARTPIVRLMPGSFRSRSRPPSRSGWQSNGVR